MSLSLYDVSIPVFRQILGALSGVLGKAIAHCDEKGIDPATLIAARLYPDMAPFPFQVMQAVNHSVGALARLRGVDAARVSGLDSLPALKAAVDQALVDLDAIRPADLDGAADREVVLTFGQNTSRFTGLGYLLSSAMPNFYFHATTAYDLLRHNGVAIGKRDFMGKTQVLA